MSMLQDAAELALSHAKELGLDQCEVSIHKGDGVSITVRQGELETIEKYNDSQLSVSVYQQSRLGNADSADLSAQGVRQTVEAAAAIARQTEADDCLGLADADRMATEFPDLDLYHPWDVDEQQLLQMATECEATALQASEEIINSEGASVNTYKGDGLYANSHGFLHQDQSSRHGISCSVIAARDGAMQRDYWYDGERNPSKLASAGEVGGKAAERTLARLGSRKIASCKVPIIYDATVAKSLFGHMLGAIRGGAIYKKASFMLDKLSQQVFPEHVQIEELPHLSGGSSSSSYDNEGVATNARNAIIADGRLQTYLLGSYTARKLGMQTTAHAGGTRNLRISDTGQSQQDLIAQIGQGLLVTELIGSGINGVTGDYSRGAAGFWIENGEIAYPVEEITVAGNLLDMYQRISAIATDTDCRGNTHCGSVLVSEMTVAGA